RLGTLEGHLSQAHGVLVLPQVGDTVVAQRQVGLELGALPGVEATLEVVHQEFDDVTAGQLAHRSTPIRKLDANDTNRFHFVYASYVTARSAVEAGVSTAPRAQRAS